MGIKSVLLAVLCVAFVQVAPPAQADQLDDDDIAAYSISSLEWRDCAGHFFYMAQMLQSEGGGDMVKLMNNMGYMAIYFSEVKAKAERKQGQTKNGLGQPLADPESGKLRVDVKTMINTQASNAKTYAGEDEYEQAYALKCKPVVAFENKFTDALMQSK